MSLSGITFFMENITFLSDFLIGDINVKVMEMFIYYHIHFASILKVK